MLVQAQVVPWWGTGRSAELSPSGFHPVTGITHRQEDRRVRLQNRVVSTTARRALHTLSRNEKFEFFWRPAPSASGFRFYGSVRYQSWRDLHQHEYGLARPQL